MHLAFESLNMKNEWLRKFLKITESYLEHLENLPDAALKDVDYFLNNRQSLLNIIETCDQKLNKILEDTSEAKKLYLSEKEKIDSINSEKQNLINKISELDQKILTLLNKYRNESEEQLLNIKRGKRVLSAYRQDKSDNSSFDLQL